jgi:alkylated DNA repair protein alkB homolog 7
VDNTEASGSWIAAVSLGGERVLRMKSESDKDKTFEVLLPSGSAYVQRSVTSGKGYTNNLQLTGGSGTVRYLYKHSILAGGMYFKGRCVPESQRLSVMLRVSLNHVIPQNSP